MLRRDQILLPAPSSLATACDEGEGDAGAEGVPCDEGIAGVEDVARVDGSGWAMVPMVSFERRRRVLQTQYTGQSEETIPGPGLKTTILSGSFHDPPLSHPNVFYP